MDHGGDSSPRMLIRTHGPDLEVFQIGENKKTHTAVSGDKTPSMHEFLEQDNHSRKPAKGAGRPTEARVRHLRILVRKTSLLMKYNNSLC